jgi:HEAT repeat protein
MKLRRALLLTAGLVVAGVAALRTGSKSTLAPTVGAGDGEPAAVVSDEGAAASAASVSRAGWRAGARHTYRLSFSTILDMGGSAPNPLLDLTSELETTVITATDERTEMSWRFGALVLGAPAGDAGRGQLLAALHAPFVVTYDGAGRPSSLAFAPQVPRQLRALLGELVATAQFVGPAAPARRWTATENVPAGEATASYVQRAGREYTRRRERLARVAGEAGLALPGPNSPALDVNEDRIILGDDGRIERAVAAVRYHVALEQAALRVATRVALTLVRTGASQVPLAEATRPEGATDEEPLWGSPQRFAAARLDRLRRIVGGATRAELLRDARDADVLGDDERRYQVTRRLGALALLEPALIDELRAAARGAADARPFVGALAENGTAAAKAALAALATDGAAAPASRAAAVDALGDDRAPTPESQAALTRALGDSDAQVRKAAGLALGTAALASAGSEAAGRSVEALRQRLRDARTTEDVVDALEALGNAGSAEALDEIFAALRADDVDVRAAAARALRAIPGARADAALLAVLASEPSPEVQVAAVFAAQFRPLAPLMDGLDQAYRRSPPIAVRQAIVAALGGALRTPDGGGAAPLLTWIAQNEANVELRAAAAARLADAS